MQSQTCEINKRLASHLPWGKAVTGEFSLSLNSGRLETDILESVVSLLLSGTTVGTSGERE